MPLRVCLYVAEDSQTAQSLGPDDRDVPPYTNRNAPQRHPRHPAAPLRVAARVRRLVGDARNEQLAEQLRHGRCGKACLVGGRRVQPAQQ